MHILRRLPFGEAPAAVEVAGEVVPIRAYQIVLQVSLSVGERLADDVPRFPAVLDTGHSHNFSISEPLLVRWAGMDPADCRKIGAILINRQEVPLLGANLWIHRNRPGMQDTLPRPVRLAIPEGISVYPAGAASAPRLPLPGLRGLIRNRLRLVIDGTEVSLVQKLRT